jgi:ABC-type phosphate transport system permease subunit
MGVMGLIINDQFQLMGSNTESTTLATHIFVVMGGESPDIQTACGIALLILIIVLILNFLVKIVDHQFRKRLKSGGHQS